MSQTSSIGSKTADIASELATPRDHGGSVASVMTTTPHACHLGDSVRHALRIMWDADCGAVPIIDEKGRPIAIVTDRDIAMAAYTRGHLELGSTVSTTMSAKLYSCSPNDSIDEALARMCQQHVRRLVVVDGAGKLVGILSLADLARQAVQSGNNTRLVYVANALGAICASRQSAHSADG